MAKQPKVEAYGPGIIEEKQIAPDAMLDGATNAEYVTISNPLPVPFKGVVGQTRPVNTPFEVHKIPELSGSTSSEEDVARNYGLNLKNPSHEGKTHLTRSYEIPSGKTLTMPAGDAQVIVRQLVTAVLQHQGKKLQLADAHARHAVEEQIIRKRGHMNDLLGDVETVSDRAQTVIDKMNEEQFPDADPEPGKGVSYEPKK